MRYIINKTSGEKLTEVIDTTVDQTTTSLTIIGNNYAGYGEYLNENFVKLLENGSNLSAPTSPLVGQLWYDSKNNRLKVYNGLNFKETGGPLVQGNAPIKQTKGDLWIDSVENQLYFYDGAERQLAGPIYKNSQKISGFSTDTILDTKNNSRTIVRLWVGQELIGIFSKETTEFTPKSVIPGFTGKIYPGFNQGTVSGLKFNAIFDSAMSLKDSLGVEQTAESFMRTNANTGSIGTLTIKNSIPLILGTSQEVSILSDVSNLQIINNSSGLNQVISLRNNVGVSDAILIDSTQEKIGFFNTSPTEKLSVSGNAIIDSSLAAGAIQPTTLRSEIISVSSSVLDLSLGNHFSKILSQNSTLTISNIPQQSGIAVEITLEVYNTGNYLITWWNNIRWADDFPPVLSVNGHDVFKFITTDNGATWIGYVESENLIPAASYTIAADVTSVSEGGIVSFTVNTTNITNGTVLYWTIEQVSGNITAGDFSDSSLAGAVTINNNTGTIAIPIANEYEADGTDSFRLQLRSNYTGGTILATSAAVTINDVVYTLTSSANTVNENATITFTVTTTNLTAPQTLYWEIEGTVVADDFTDPALTGNVVITSNIGTISKTTVADMTNEGQEALRLFLYTDNTKSKLIAFSNLITVYDTSVLEWDKVSAGGSFVIAKRNNSSLWAWGLNSSGELGNGTTINRSSPVVVIPTYNWNIISAGDSFSAAIKSDGSLWSWGVNTYGQLGDNTKTSRRSPVQVAGSGVWSSVSAGYTNMSAIKPDGTLWVWGQNTYGQLGDGTTSNRSSPVQVAGGGTWSQISAGKEFTLGIKSDGTLWAWGNNLYGALGVAGITSRVSPGIVDSSNWLQISTSKTSYHSAAIKSDGTLWSWGYNANGALGDGTTTNRSSPVQVVGGGTWKVISSGDLCAIGIKSDDTLWSWGAARFIPVGQSSPTSITGTGNQWREVSAGFLMVAAINNDGTLWMWGTNNWGQLGDGTTTSRISPAEVLGYQPVYSIVSDTALTSEGNSVPFVINTQGMNDGRKLYWSSKSIDESSITAADFVDNQTSGFVEVYSNTATLTRPLAADTTSDTLEQFQIELRTLSTTGPIIATSSTVSVNDTSLPTTYNYFMTKRVSSRFLSVKVDADDNIYAVGNVGGGYTNAAIVKYDKLGNFNWGKFSNLYNNDGYRDVVISNATKYIYTVGTEGIWYGSGQASIMKLTPRGNIVWSKKFGIASTANIMQGIDIDSSDNIYVGGTVGASVGEVAKIDSNGNLVWQKRLVASDIIYIYGLKLDADGNVIIAGTVKDGTYYKILVAKFDNSGNTLWQKYISHTQHIYANSVTVDNLGNIYLAGAISQGASIDIIRPYHSGPSSAVILKITSAGAISWQKTIASRYYGNGTRIDFRNNSLFITGYDGNVSGFYRLFVAKYNTSGTLQWNKYIDTSPTDQAGSTIGVAIDSNGDYIVGYQRTNGSIQKLPGNGTLTGNYVINNDEIITYADSGLTDSISSYTIADGVATVSAGTASFSSYGVSPVAIYMLPTTIVSAYQPVTDIPTGNLLAYYNASSAASTVWTDRSSYQNHVTLANGPTFGTYPTQVIFDGSNDIGSLINSSLLNITYTGKTIAVIARLSSSMSNNTYRALCGNTGSTSGRNFNFYLHRDSSGNYKIHYSAAGVGTVSDTLPGFTVGDFFFAAITHNTDGTVTHYFNGSQLGSTVTGVTFSQFVAGRTEYIGGADNTYWQGGIKAIMLYGRTLSAGEITTIYNNLYLVPVATRVTAVNAAALVQGTPDVRVTAVNAAALVQGTPDVRVTAVNASVLVSVT